MASQISLLTGDAPLRTQPQAVFDQNMNDFMSEFPPMILQINQVATEAEADAAAAEAAKLAAQAAQLAAELAEDNAAGSAASAANAPGTNATSSTSTTIPLQSALPVSISISIQPGKAYLNQRLHMSSRANPANFIQGPITAHNPVTGALTLRATHAQGVGTYADWDVSIAPAIMSTVANAVVARSGNFTSYKYENGQINECSASLTASLDQIATLGSSWYNYYTAPANGTVTIDPNGSEQIGGPGLTVGNTQTISNGESCVVIAGPSAFTMIKFQARQGLQHLSIFVPTAGLSTLDFLTICSSSYDNYRIVISGVKTTSLVSDSMVMRLAVAGAAVTSADYGNTSNTSGTFTAGSTVLFAGPSNCGLVDIVIDLLNVNDTSMIKSLTIVGSGYVSAGSFCAKNDVGVFNSLSAVTGFRLYWNGGNTFAAGGSVSVFGYRKS